jgi:hypothetical protein
MTTDGFSMVLSRNLISAPTSCSEKTKFRVKPRRERQEQQRDALSTERGWNANW